MKRRAHALTFGLGLLGGLAGASILRAIAPEPAFAAPPPKSIAAEEFRLVDATGKTYAQLVRSNEGSPVLFFMDKDGHARLQVGLYPDGLPVLALMDAKNQAVGLFRIAGSQGSPVLVLKAQGKDRMIVGLEMEKASQDPFIEHTDDKGEKRQLIERK